MPATPIKRQPDVTRQRLLECAFDEIYRCGFRAASLDAILRDSGVTKGALYHHFDNKTALGYAVVDEVVRPWIEGIWKPLAEAEDFVGTALALSRERLRERGDRVLAYGCPLNNLINEMASVDEGFRERLLAIMDEWRSGLAEALRRGQKRGRLRRGFEPAAAADFIIACIEGSYGLAKLQQSPQVLQSVTRGLADYLEQLRA
ncbi:MAG TPA: TetR/AcrR family transcriptional regulator [Solimonas sp.]|nr:TetR/AcrR family transcriptional regulator [Solimonas sp.]